MACKLYGVQHSRIALASSRPKRTDVIHAAAGNPTFFYAFEHGLRQRRDVVFGICFHERVKLVAEHLSVPFGKVGKGIEKHKFGTVVAIGETVLRQCGIFQHNCGVALAKSIVGGGV